MVDSMERSSCSPAPPPSIGLGESFCTVARELMQPTPFARVAQPGSSSLTRRGCRTIVAPIGCPPGVFPMYCQKHSTQKHSTQKHSTANTTILAIFAVTLLVWATHAPAQEEKVLHSFNSSDGASPDAGLVFDSAGNLYGTTYSGGSHGSGTVFELAPAAGGKWKEKVLYSFSHSSDGFGPAAALIMDGAGNLYGTAAGGGAHSAGLVFELTPETGGGWTETVLHDFSPGTAPLSGLVRDAAGNLYGTGGAGGIGLVFELLPSSGGSWTAKVLYKFNTTDGFFPQGGLLLGASGNLYGTTEYGGTDSYGTVYELKPETG